MPPHRHPAPHGAPDFTRLGRAFAAAPMLLLGLTLATCETLPAAPETAATFGQRVALLAVDVDALAARVASGEASKLDVSLWVDGAPVARAALEGAPPEGRLTWPLSAGDHEVSVVVRDGRGTARGELHVHADADTVIPMVVTPAAAAAAGADAAQPPAPKALRTNLPADTLTLTAGRRCPLPTRAGATVDYRNTQLPQGWQQRLGAAPAARIAAMLADPQIAVLTPVTANRSGVDRIGPLVPWQATSAPRTQSVARSTGPAGVGSRRAPHASASPAVRATPVIPALVRTYTYCSCGKPVANKAYTLRTTDQREFHGRTDAFGLVIVRNATLASVSYGVGQRARKRSYPFQAGTQETREHMLRALGSADPNEALTALLDLRRTQLPSARAILLRMLDHPDAVRWRNAALALGHFDQVQTEAAERTRLLRAGVDMTRQLFVLGALRRPSALPALVPFVRHRDANIRRLAVWAIGFVGHPDGAATVAQVLGDADADVRAEAALSLGRCGTEAHIADLEPLLSDRDSAVAARAAEAVGLLQGAAPATR